MKNRYPIHSSFRVKVLGLVLPALLALSGSQLCAQENDGRTGIVYPAFGIGIGFFYPGDVNDYIEASLPAGYVMEYGFNDLIMNITLQGGVTFRMKQFDISGLFEYALAPKYIMVTNGDDYPFFFHRFSPGIAANYYVPVGTGRHAFMVGGGINYSFMKFEQFTGSSPGFRIQAGFSLQFGHFNLQPYGAFSYAKATDNETDWGDFTLNYTGGQIGVNLSFHPSVNYK